MGQRMKRIHMISGSKLFDALLMAFKQGLSAKLRERIVIHQNLEGLHNYVPKDLLPKEFGGDERSVKELNGIYYTVFI